MIFIVFLLRLAVAYAALCGVLIPSRGLGGAVLALGIVSLVQGVVTAGVVARASS